MNYHVVTVLLLCLAVALYAIGLALPATAILVLGVLAEGAFWIRFLRGLRRKSKT